MGGAKYVLMHCAPTREEPGGARNRERRGSSPQVSANGRVRPIRTPRTTGARQGFTCTGNCYGLGGQCMRIPSLGPWGTSLAFDPSDPAPLTTRVLATGAAAKCTTTQIAFAQAAACCGAGCPSRGIRRMLGVGSRVGRRRRYSSRKPGGCSGGMPLHAAPGTAPGSGTRMPFSRTW
ncbi:hypothetical protein DFH09DRAFT_224885 [Mycena vulgaris]|nr:hypothetical protein DFH09DRAFT_224885 [Mycena vulgaris]